jgi:hypothetical protein
MQLLAGAAPLVVLKQASPSIDDHGRAKRCHLGPTRYSPEFASEIGAWGLFEGAQVHLLIEQQFVLKCCSFRASFED